MIRPIPQPCLVGGAQSSRPPHRFGLLLALTLALRLLPASAPAQIAPTTVLTGPHRYLLQDRTTLEVIARGSAGSSGVAFDRLILAPNTAYRIWLLQDASLLTGYLDILSPDSGQRLPLPEIRLGTDISPDRDGDGLGEDGEFIAGTSITNPDTDGDGVADGAEIRQGTDPLSGRAVRTGIIATAPLVGTAVDIVAANDLAVVACGDPGISVFNIFNGMSPAVVALVDTPGDARRVALSGSLVVAADGSAGLAVIDITDPPAATIVRQLPLGGTVTAVALADRVAFAGLSSQQIVVVDVVTGSELARVGGFPGAIEDLALAGDYLYAVTSDKVHVLALAGGEFKLGASVNSPIVSTGTRRLAVGGGILYAVHGKGYNTFNLDNPGTPALIRAGNTTQFGWKQLAPTGSGLAVAAVDANFALDGPNDISLYNVADPGNVNAFVTTFPTPGLARSLALYNGLAYVADSPAGLQVINYLAYDALGRAPTIALRAGFSLDPPQAEEASLTWVEARVTDDVQVRNVEFYVDGTKVATDGNFPFETRIVTPRRADGRRAFTLRARASDTGGNTAWSQEYLVNLVADGTPPRVTRTVPLAGAISGSVDSIVAAFSEPLDPATVTPESFRAINAGPDSLFGTADDVVVAGGSLSYRETVNTVVLQFTAALPAGDYQGIAAPPIADRAGNPMASSVRWRFRVFDRQDQDRDGVPDEVELLLGLDPTKADSNNNGIPDGLEDIDRDGLPNAAEILLGSDPKNPRSIDPNILDGNVDRDGDALPDGREVLVGTNPLVADSDGDGWNDESEVTAASDPLDRNFRPQLLMVSGPAALRIGLPRLAGAGAGAGLTVAGPPIRVGLAAMTGDLRSGVAVAQPPVRIGVAGVGDEIRRGVVVGQPTIRIGLPAATGAGADPGVTVGHPPLKIRIGP